MTQLSGWKSKKGSPREPKSKYQGDNEKRGAQESDLQSFLWAPGLATNYTHESDANQYTKDFENGTTR